MPPGLFGSLMLTPFSYSHVSLMSSHSSWALAWLASHRSLRERWYPILSGYWQDDSLTHLLSGCTLIEVKQEPAGELTERWDWKDGVPLLIYPLGPLGDGGMSSNPLPPPCMVAAPLIYWEEVASTNAACLKEIGWKQCPQRKCPHPDKVHGTFL